MSSDSPTPASAPQAMRGRFAVEAVVAALAAVCVVWLGNWGYASLQSTREVGHRAQRAVAIADAVASSAGRDLVKPGALDTEAKRLLALHKPLIAGIFVTEQGGVDEFGIARGARIKWGEHGLSAATKQAIVNQEKGLIAAAEQAMRAKKRLSWSRLITGIDQGQALIAVPYRKSAASAVSGVAGVIVRATPAPARSPDWVWLAPLLAALLTFVALMAGLHVMAAGTIGQLGAAAMVIFAAPALISAAEGGVQILAADHLMPHDAPPVNAALAAAEGWLAGSLCVLAAVLGGILGFCAGLLRAIRRDPTPYAYVGPAMAATGVLIFVPFFVGVGLSFTAVDGTFIGIDNYVEVIRSLADPNSATQFGRTLVHTIIWTVLNVTAHVTIGLGLALILNRPNLRGRKLYRLLLIVPWAVPNYITALIWKWMFNTQYGPVNVMLGMLGVDTVDWLGESMLTNFLANLVTNIWLGFPFMMVISLGALQSIPADLYEAASIDGASGWQKFKHITVPLLKPALFPAIILGTIWTFNAFNVIYLVSGGGPDHQTEILITEAYYLFTVLRRMGLAAAYSVLIFVLLMAYTLITNKLTSATEAVDE
ncbi:MAG: sugar ABC transporter permease [Myxococcales bacterium]|nr:sugar ABC transporter permease [Myxococcales bacterium]